MFQFRKTNAVEEQLETRDFWTEITMETAVPDATKHGIIKGRDALFLHVIVMPNEGQLILKGDINTYGGEDEKYEIQFNGIVYLSMVELDFSEGRSSSFGIVRNSKIIGEFRRLDHSAKLSDHHRHFYFDTYDTVFEIVAFDYQLKWFPL